MGMGTGEFSELSGIPVMTLRRLHDSGKFRAASMTKGGHRRYEESQLEEAGFAFKNRRRKPGYQKVANREFFSSPLSPVSAYVLGFFWADGCLVKAKRNSRGVSFECAEQDKDLIYSIREAMRSEHKISERVRRQKSGKLTKMVQFQVFGERLVTDLESYGASQNKRHKNLEPLNVPSSEFPHFVRGFFDGDGCLSLKKSQRGAELTFTGSHATLVWIRDGLSRLLGVEVRPVVERSYRTKAHTHDLKYFRLRTIESILNHLYEDAQLFLPRKKQKFELLKMCS